MANKTAPKPAAGPVEAAQEQQKVKEPVEDKPAETVDETETPPEEETEAECDVVAEAESTTDDDVVTEVNGKSDNESLKRKETTIECDDSPKKKKIEAEVQEEKPVEVVA